VDKTTKDYTKILPNFGASYQKKVNEIAKSILEKD
jgi:hypothetical protein